MKKIFIFLAVGFGLASCALLPPKIESQPLSKTLDAVKRELSAFQYALAQDKKKQADQRNYLIQCNDSGTDAADVIEIEEIEVSLSLATEIEGGAEGEIARVLELGGSKSRTTTDSYSMVLTLSPESIPSDNEEAYDNRNIENGIATHMLAIVDEYAKVNNEQPCLTASKTELTLGFDVAESKEGNIGVDLEVISFGGSKSKETTVSNELVVEFNFGDAQTFQ